PLTPEGSQSGLLAVVGAGAVSFSRPWLALLNCCWTCPFTALALFRSCTSGLNTLLLEICTGPVPGGGAAVAAVSCCLPEQAARAASKSTGKKVFMGSSRVGWRLP